MAQEDGRLALGAHGAWGRATEMTPDLAARCEDWGYGAIWIGGSPGGDLASVRAVLEATRAVPVATGIVNMWRDQAPAIATTYKALEADHPGRFMLGVGIGHPESTDEYRSPFDKMVDYLDTLEANGVPSDRIILAALGPRALSLAANRTGGAHPYLTTPTHTRTARRLLGADCFLAPEQTVVLAGNEEHRLRLARDFVARYLRLSNYRANFEREGWPGADLDNGGSDALVDALVLNGDPGAIAKGIRAHLNAGADHVAVQVLGDARADGFRILAEALS